MIAHLRGRLLFKRPNQAVLDTGGVGYDVAITVPTFSELPSEGSEVSLFIHTHVREDAIALFGFLRAEEKQLFEKLISVSGIGPKLAITVLSGMSFSAAVAAIRSNDLGALTRIPGVGKKTAERMVLELRDKLEQFGEAQAASARVSSPVEEDVLSALVNLGYQKVAVERAIIQAARSHKNGGRAVDFEPLFRESLAMLSK
jgi:holliday junction DNA helicase RuvA